MLKREMEFPNNTSSSLVGVGVAPFVMKTYQMVNDPSTDHLICWGPANNSFVVVDPLLFSRLLLPSFFKHSNFSSFIRQLNTYGFRKVDPDRWEFASEWFLRGQNQLLMNMGRRKNNNTNTSSSAQEEEEEDSEMEMEIGRMRREQDEMEKEIQGMTKRLETTERRPDQMMDFLCKVVDDPQIMPKMMLERERRTRKRQITTPADDNKRRFVLPETTESNSAKTEEEEASSSLGMDSSSEVDTNWIGDAALMEFVSDAPPLSFGVQLDPNSPPYPFSLLDGDF